MFIRDILDTALDEPRFDVSGINKIIYDPRFDMKVQKSLEKVSSAEPWFPSAFPSMYAVPSGVQILGQDTLIGGAHTQSPLSGAVGVG